MANNYFNTLNVPPDCTQEDVKRNFRRLALEHHPDKGGQKERSKRSTTHTRCCLTLTSVPHMLGPSLAVQAPHEMARLRALIAVAKGIVMPPLLTVGTGNAEKHSEPLEPRKRLELTGKTPEIDVEMQQRKLRGNEKSAVKKTTTSRRRSSGGREIRRMATGSRQANPMRRGYIERLLRERLGRLSAGGGSS
jgi:hypothetical protein